MSKKALGRGLGALIGDDPIEDNSGYLEIEIFRIKPNPNQPRKDFDSESLQELSNSIKTHGLLQPLLVRPQEDNYIIIAGERRYRAALLAELDKIPCIIQECDDQESAERALIENIQRKDLSPIEEGKAYARLMNDYGMTQEQMAERVGKGRPTIANLLRIIQLPERVLQLINENKISLGHAKVLLGVKDLSLQVLLAEKVAKENLSVRQLEMMIKKFSEPDDDNHNEVRKHSPPTIFNQVEDELRNSLQTKVSIKGNLKRGKIEINYFSEEEFNRLLEIWNIQIE